MDDLEYKYRVEIRCDEFGHLSLVVNDAKVGSDLGIVAIQCTPEGYRLSLDSEIRDLKFPANSLGLEPTHQHVQSGGYR